jgi:hypothetical protein
MKNQKAGLQPAFFCHLSPYFECSQIQSLSSFLIYKVENYAIC